MKSLLLTLSLSISVCAAATLLSGPTAAKADDVYTFIIKKQEQKESNRWTLASWLETRDKMRLMDLWLAIHSPTPYEFFFGGDMQWGDRVSGGRYTGMRAQAAAYATIFGLQLDHEFSPISQSIAQFNLRVFGYNSQGTHITLFGGLRSRTDPQRIHSAVAGVLLTLYVARHFGFDTLWRHYFAATPNGSGTNLVGNRFEGGAFIDFRFLRLYGSYFKETDIERTGVLTGLRLYF